MAAADAVNNHVAAVAAAVVTAADSVEASAVAGLVEVDMEELADMEAMAVMAVATAVEDTEEAVTAADMEAEDTAADMEEVATAVDMGEVVTAVDIRMGSQGHNFQRKAAD